MVFICISLIISNVENLFMLAVGHLYVFFRKNVYSGPLPIFQLVFFVFAVELYVYLVYFYANAFSNRYFANIFSYSIGCLSIWWWLPLLCRRFLVRCSPTFKFLLLLPLLLMSNPKNCCQNWCQGDYPCVFLYEFYDFRSYI